MNNMSKGAKFEILARTLLATFGSFGCAIVFIYSLSVMVQSAQIIQTATMLSFILLVVLSICCFSVRRWQSALWIIVSICLLLASIAYVARVL